MAKLKKYAIVGYMSDSAAKEAFEAAIKRFKHGSIFSSDLSRREGNIIYLQADTEAEITRMEKFLLAQPDAQPRGCHLPL